MMGEGVLGEGALGKGVFGEEGSGALDREEERLLDCLSFFFGWGSRDGLRLDLSRALYVLHRSSGCSLY